jgi:hypothetical protein
VDALSATAARDVMRRFHLVQKAKSARVFGILVGTLGVSGCVESSGVSVRRVPASSALLGFRYYPMGQRRLSLLSQADPFSAVSTLLCCLAVQPTGTCP